VGWHGSVRSRIRYPLLANAVQRLLTAMVGQDREEANRLQQAKWELTSRIRDESNVPNAFHFSRRSRKRYSAETVPQPVTASQGTTLCKVARNSVNRLELRKNVVANYPFESSRGFPAEVLRARRADLDEGARCCWRRRYRRSIFCDPSSARRGKSRRR
jgi:hypothetical protein